MATLTRTNSSANPTYRDYVNFLGGYKNGKKNENVGRNVDVKNFPLSTSSSNASSSSLSGSDAADCAKSSCISYNAFLENSKTKRFGSVKPRLEEKSKPGPEEARATKKSEVFIEIQPPARSVIEISKIFEDGRKPAARSGGVGSRIGAFEKQTSVENKPRLAVKPNQENGTPSPRKAATPPPNPDQERAFAAPPPPPPPPMPSPNGPASPPAPPAPPSSRPPKLQATLKKGPQATYSVNNPGGALPSEIDRNDPLVRKLVYGTLRGLYGAYHDQASGMLATLPRNMVVRSNGVQDRIEQIAQQSRLPGLKLSLGVIHSPPPTRNERTKLESEILEIDKMDPPQCVQNAMMKQDKKPFTYTPGGIDLSEIKSPRMARRIERNANYTGSPEAPRPAPQQPVGPLPPSALAAMQPQMHVQVFPSGPPPPPPVPKSGAAPPPPPPMNMPPPPPPPSGPLPTQKIVTSENQVLERPDMTKIIPDNPMALLRKTSGPQVRTTLIDELYDKKDVRSPPIQQKQPWSPPVQQQRPPPVQPVQQQRSPPVQPVQQQPSPRWPQIPPTQNQNHQSPPPPEPPRYQPKIIERSQQPEPQKYQPKAIGRTPSEEEPIKTSTAHLGSLYIPPINQQQQRNVTSPPPPKKDPQSPQVPSPGTPTLKEAPKPWQKQPKQPEELPPWAKKEAAAPPVQQEPVQQQQRFVQNRPAQPSSEPHPNAVYVTQPIVLQHPGPPPNRQQQQPPKPRAEDQGAIIIPVQIEKRTKTPATPTTPGNERSLNRQQSWGNNPTQSNSFRVLQKITNTDGEDDNDSTPVTEHPPRYPQHFQQTSTDQMRKLKLSEGDRELMNRFKQGVDDDTSLHNEVDPRYRGPAIPSKAFKLLQSMTDGSSDLPTVSRGPAPGGNKTPQVRTIPIQIERDDQTASYVHPSEQTVPEPKKYTGSSIPSRSFKILQAMTAPDSCANANEVNENCDPSSYNRWGYDPNYPPPSPYYYYNYYYQNSKEQNENKRDIRQTPVPFWGYCPPPPPPPPSPYPFVQRPLRTPDVEADAGTARNTPLPWGYYPPYYAPTPTRELEERGNYPQDYKEDAPPPPQYQYAMYWDPYYYYYGYPPVYSPYPFYEPSENEEIAGYSSTDEMAYFSRKMKNERDRFSRETSKTPRVLATPGLSQELVQEKSTETESERDSSESDSETEVETEEERLQTSRNRSSNGLQAIRSVKDINVYDNENEDQNSDDGQSEECSEETEDNEDSVSYVINEEAIIPHQLSVIFEESERSESKRESSVLSDSTTIAEKSDVEEDDDKGGSSAVSVKLPPKSKMDEENVATVTVGESEAKVEEGGIVASCSDETPVSTGAELETEAVICTSDDNKTIPNIGPNKTKAHNVQEGREEEEEEEQDWWEILAKDDDDLPVRPKSGKPHCTEDVNTENEEHASSTSSSNSSSSGSSPASKKEEEEQKENADSSSESEEESDSSEDSDDDKGNAKNEENNDNSELLSVKERIQALKDSIKSKRDNLEINEEPKMSVKEKILAIESGNLQNNSKATSTKSSVKSFEEFSEEEGDSGVTSDMSRHISDNEEFPELKKMTRYQRAATHSRLFKLLQEVCEGEEDDENENKAESVGENNVVNLTKEEASARRDQLTLPLNVGNESFSSGITSPGSPVSDRLVTELVQSILKRKKGQIFRNLSKEKLVTAARKILQEEFLDDLSTPDSSFLSPLRSTESSTPAQTPQEFYNDYMQYYDSWSDAYQENYDILPSKAFRLLQEHSGTNKPGAIAGLLAKCPKLLSSNKNVHQELLKLMEEPPENPSKSLESSEVTTAS